MFQSDRDTEAAEKREEIAKRYDLNRTGHGITQLCVVIDDLLKRVRELETKVRHLKQGADSDD